MFAAQLPGWLVVGSLALLAVLALTRTRRWLQGRPNPVSLIGGLFKAPGRYLHDVHDVVVRTPVISVGRHDSGDHTARMHMLFAGGFVAATVLIPLVHLFGLGGRILAAVLVLMLAAMLVGLVFLAQRRKASTLPARLSKGRFNRLPLAGAAFIACFFIATLPHLGVLSAINWVGPIGLLVLAVGAWACLELYIGMAAGPMKHAFNGILHLAWHPRQRRFEGVIDSGLKPLPLAESAAPSAPVAKLGVETAADFKWNQLLGFDACVQCGRCEAACPANAAGLPLNPKKLIQDLVVAIAAETDAAYSGSPHPGRPIGQGKPGAHGAIVGEDAIIHPDTLWACTTCRACVQECPMMIEHVDAVIDMRRFQTLEKAATPGKAAGALEELRATDNLSGKPNKARLEWATDLKLPVMADKKAADVLLWLGEGAFDLRHQRTLRALIKLLRAANVDFAVLGEEELDCGDVPRRLGDEATFQSLARRNLATLARYQFNKIVTADPHVLQVIRNEYPALGKAYAVEHHTTFLNALVAAGKLKVGQLSQAPSLTYHDPCYLGRYNGEIDAPRNLLKGIGIKVVEMERSGMRSSCCGWGGGATFTDVPGKRRIPDVRMEHVKETDAQTVAVACPNCMVMLEGVVQPRPDVVDVAELMLAALEAAPAQAAPAKAAAVEVSA